MFTIAKRFKFEAAHHLGHLPSDHKCSRVHGHSYQVEIVLRGQMLNRDFFIVDYGDLSWFKDYIDSTLDHQDLNDLIAFPTAENLAQYLFNLVTTHYFNERELFEVLRVRVSETENTWAEFESAQWNPPSV